jgi:putative addiction module killer protein
MQTTVIVYADNKGKEPFSNWLTGLSDARIRRRVIMRLRRIEQGHFGDCKHLQDNVFELRLFFGPGYRIYLGKDGDKLVVLLCGGDKSTQQKDIFKALNFWNEYKHHA